MVTHQKLYTADDLWELSHLPEYADKRLELVQGDIIEMSPTAGAHGIVASKLDRLLGNYVEDHDLGITTWAETGYLLAQDESGKTTVRAPDFGFVTKERWK